MTANLYKGRQVWVEPLNPSHRVERFEVAARALITHQDRVLLVYEADADIWVIPGGKLSPSESLLQGLRREIDEETGLEVKIGDMAAVFDILMPRDGYTAHKFEFVFHASPMSAPDFIERDVVDGDQAGSPVSKMRWFTAAELATVSVCPPFVRDFAALRAPSHPKRYWGVRTQEDAPPQFDLSRFYISARAVTMHNDALLLVRNKKSEWWYGAGGAIDLAELIPAAAEREVFEESGLHATAHNVLAVDEFYMHGAGIHQINFYTRCTPVHGDLSQDWEDHAGYVEEARFFSADEFRQHPKAFPRHLLDIAWPHLSEHTNTQSGDQTS